MPLTLLEHVVCLNTAVKYNLLSLLEKGQRHAVNYSYNDNNDNYDDKVSFDLKILKSN